MCFFVFEKNFTECGFCKRPSSNGYYSRAKSKDHSDIMICNACSTYENAHGTLQRKLRTHATKKEKSVTFPLLV